MIGGNTIRKNKKISKLLRRHCAQCGSCCCDPIIEVTHHDLHRLVKHTGIPADKLIKLYSRSTFGSDDDHDWIKLSYSKRKIGLRKKRDGTCIFLSPDKQCTAYEARPMSCRTFPIDVVLDENNKIIDFSLSDVIRDRVIRCRHSRSKERSFKKFRLEAEQARNESASYWEKIARWNALPEKGGKLDFLEFLGFETNRN